jgi:hypothetical protein
MDNIRFAFVADGDIFHYMTFPNNDDLQGVIAGLRSRPLLVEIPEGYPDHFGPGWKYVDGEFVNTIAPAVEDYEVE